MISTSAIQVNVLLWGFSVIVKPQTSRRFVSSSIDQFQWPLAAYLQLHACQRQTAGSVVKPATSIKQNDVTPYSL